MIRRHSARLCIPIAGICFPLLFPLLLCAQPPRQTLHSGNVLYNKRLDLANDLRDRIIERTFSTPPDSDNDVRYESACDAVSQFLFHTPAVDRGFRYLFASFDSLSFETRRAFLEALYAVGDKKFATQVAPLLDKVSDPELFSICAVYLYRADSSVDHANAIKIRMVERFPGYDTIPLLDELAHYLSLASPDLSLASPAAKTIPPDIGQLFAWRAGSGSKTIYSFQRGDRDYPGLAVVQNANGRFVRNGDGRIAMFRQLARSGPGLPFFLHDGNTPQGAYSIQGCADSHTPYIGPTPTIQMRLPFEVPWDEYFHREPAISPVPDATAPASQQNRPSDSLEDYKALFPPGWTAYAPMMEAWIAGRIGRSAIIAHGTTIDPEYFSGMPFYPLTPTMGCLCAEEQWNPTTGGLLTSEQYGLVSAWQSTPGGKGTLYVIDLDDQHKTVTREEVERLIARFENAQLRLPHPQK